MEELFNIGNAFTLIMLILLQVVLGFDNLLYISLESQRAPKEKRKFVINIGVLIAVILRIILLFSLMAIIDKIKTPLFSLNFYAVSGSFNFHSLIVLLGGVFIIYTAIKEIFHMIAINPSLNLYKESNKNKSVISVITSIVLMNLVFSFDSILGAMALTKIFTLMVIAIISGGVMMIWLSSKVSELLKKNRIYEVLGLFILFIVGIMLLSEGGHLSHLKLFGNEVKQMTKTTFYFAIFILVISDLVQGRYQSKLLRKQEQLKNNKS